MRSFLFFSVLLLLSTASFGWAGQSVPPTERPALRDTSGERVAADKELRNALTPLSAKERKALHGATRFDACDQDNDGLLSRSEFRRCFPRAGVKFLSLDTNRDNHVSKEEIQAYLAAPQGTRDSKYTQTTPEQRKAAREQKAKERRQQSKRMQKHKQSR